MKTNSAQTPANGFLAASIAAATLLSFGTNKASAHAVGIGYTPGASPGSVNLWLGSYHNNGQGDGNDLEGSANLVGVNVIFNATTPFTYSTPGPVGAPFVPAGLVLGTNLQFSSGFGPSDTFSWEAVTISGLVAGTYTFNYVPQANPTAHWYPWGDLQGINLTLAQGDVSGGGTNVGSVPDGGSTVALLGLAMGGIAAGRRKLGLV